MPVAPGWLSLGTVPFCYSVPFGPVNSVAHNGLLILFERVGGKTTPMYKATVRLDQMEQQLPDSLLLFFPPSKLPKIAISGTVWSARLQATAPWEKSSPQVLFQDRTATGIILKVSIYHPYI